MVWFPSTMVYLPQISTPNPHTNTSTRLLRSSPPPPPPHPPYAPNVLCHSVWHFVYDAYVLKTILSIYVLMNLCNTSTNVATVCLSSNKKYDVFAPYNAIVQLLNLAPIPQTHRVVSLLLSPITLLFALSHFAAGSR